MFEIVKTGPRCHSVVNTETKRVVAKCTSLVKAKTQVRLLMEEKPTTTTTTKPKPTGTNSWVVHVKKVAQEKGISYREALKVAGETYQKKSPVKGKKIVGGAGRGGIEIPDNFYYQLKKLKDVFSGSKAYNKYPYLTQLIRFVKENRYYILALLSYLPKQYAIPLGIMVKYPEESVKAVMAANEFYKLMETISPYRLFYEWLSQTLKSQGEEYASTLPFTDFGMEGGAATKKKSTTMPCKLVDEPYVEKQTEFEKAVGELKENKNVKDNKGFIKEITNLFFKLLDKDATLQQKFEAGKPIFQKEMVSAVKKSLSYFGRLNKVTETIINTVIPVLANAFYDWVSKKIMERMEGGMDKSKADRFKRLTATSRRLFLQELKKL